MYINGLGWVDNLANVPADTRVDEQHADGEAFEELLAAEQTKNETKAYTMDDIFKEAAKKYNVSYDMLTAIGYHESRFQPDVTSWAGAMGVMQLMPSTAKAMGVTDAYDPYQNIMGAAKLLGQLSEMYDGDETLTLAAYAAGSGNVAKYNGVPPFGETQEFVAWVKNAMKNGIPAAADSEKIVANVSSDGSSVKDSHMQTAQAAVADNITEAVRSNADIYLPDNVYSALQRASYDNSMTYEQYMILMNFYESMLDIISDMGEDDASTKSTLF